MRILELQQGTDEWLAARAGKFTGSRFNNLMARLWNGEPGASCRNLLASLVIERLTGRPVETYQNDAMRRGTELEPLARSAYIAKSGTWVTEVGFCVHDELPFVGVSPDGLVGEDGLLEIKCPSAEAKHLDALLKGAHATEYRWQIQGQLWVTGRKWCDAVSYDCRWPEYLQLAVTRVERNEDDITQLETECMRSNEVVERLVSELRSADHDAF